MTTGDDPANTSREEATPGYFGIVEATPWPWLRPGARLSVAHFQTERDALRYVWAEPAFLLMLPLFILSALFHAHIPPAGGVLMALILLALLAHRRYPVKSSAPPTGQPLVIGTRNGDLTIVGISDAWRLKLLSLVLIGASVILWVTRTVFGAF